mgnify:CR=1 FL=1
MCGVLVYQLGAIRFGWLRVSQLWPWNALLFLGLIVHFIDEEARHA